ncbi:hypothetical protein Sgly_2752 [Syntrophobotulus glycolicus DSM 8271]|uniref:Lipoprotein n=1 Tax=Syntrophobotulus glycolicus (strain DSM 8271 / FlGlyR) TaxID=645991 RepID=F0SXW3_SYNGF|nr:hypothetical protein [Syntrophobotulus glycolicus]ADY57024.1 hypothetical protein Sgly_2752 [Syntrophobotulus glycolicus DSM 8271]
MKKIYVCFMAIFLIFGLTACGNQAEMEGKNKANFKEKKISFDPGQSFTMAKSLWYDDTNVLLVFGDNKENEHSKIISYNLDTKNSKVLYEGQFSTGYEDQILINDKIIGYQNWERAFFYDRAGLSLVDEYRKKAEDNFIRYSSDMGYLAGVRKDGLYIANNQLKESKKIDTSSQYASLSWSKDNAKLLYIANGRSDICMIDRDSMKKQTLTGGKDFQYPDGWVDLLYCRFLPNNTDILIHILGERKDTFALISSTGEKEPKFISENGNVTLMDISDQQIVYAVKENESKEEKLICYDYLTDQRHVIHNSTELIVSAGFSPDQNSVFLATLLKGGESQHQLYTFNLN